MMKKQILVSLLLVLSLVGLSIGQASAVDQLPATRGTTGLQGTISSPPPSTAATISVPSSGQVFTSTPIQVSGLCTNNTIVKLFSNNIFVGAANCESGSYKLQVDLFGGGNVLTARVYDLLDQAGPDSSSVTVNFQDANFTQTIERVSLTSTIARLGAPLGQQLSWPIVLSGGRGPYAVSVDWGDGSAEDLKSVAFTGTVDLPHTYKTAGIFRVIVKATDANGTTAYLQLIGVGSGTVTQSNSSSGGGKTADTRSIYIWWPVLLLIPFAIAAFWVGRRYEVVSIHRRLEQQASLYRNNA